MIRIRTRLVHLIGLLGISVVPTDESDFFFKKMFTTIALECWKI